MAKRKRSRVHPNNPRTQAAQVPMHMPERFAGPEEGLWSRLFGFIQGEGHVTKKGDAITLTVKGGVARTSPADVTPFV